MSLTPIRHWYNHPNLRQAAQRVQHGGVIAYPTEAVWGLGCDPFAIDAVERLLALKKRHWRKGVILIGSRWQHFAPFISHLSIEKQQKLQQSWPAPLTWLVDHGGTVPDWISGGRTQVALRMTPHPVAAALCDLVGGVIVSTSANPQAHPPARNAIKVHRYFGRQLDAITVGQVGKRAQPSEIRQLDTDQIVRAG